MVAELPKECLCLFTFRIDTHGASKWKLLRASFARFQVRFYHICHRLVKKWVTIRSEKTLGSEAKVKEGHWLQRWRSKEVSGFRGRSQRRPLA